MGSRVEQAKAKTLPGKPGHNTLVLDRQKDVLYSSSVTEFRLAKKKMQMACKAKISALLRTLRPEMLKTVCSLGLATNATKIL